MSTWCLTPFLNVSVYYRTIGIISRQLSTIKYTKIKVYFCVHLCIKKQTAH
nr:MAG TPA: hypothetical protein [Caudoviricetes sp.]